MGIFALAFAAAATAGAGRTDPPLSPEYGIAAGYPGDAGIEKDPAVILFEDYELADVEDLRQRGWDWNRDHAGVWGLTGDPAHVFAGRKSLAQHMIVGREGSIMPRDLKVPEEGPVYHRVYVYFPGDAPTTRVMGITGVRESWPTWRAIGSAGWRPAGDDYYCATLVFHNDEGRVRASWYPYHVDQKSQWGSNWWVGARIPTDRWFCLEIMTKLTTPGKVPGSEDTYRDGELRMWIDGVEVFRRTDLRWRTDPIVKTTMIFAQCYSSQPFKRAGVWYADNRVVARTYIGPMVAEKREPTHSSETDALSDPRPAARGEATGPGIASRYPGDAGIEKDPAVLCVEDFEVPDLAALQMRGWTAYHGPGLWVDGSQEGKGWDGVAIDASPGSALAGARCLKNSVRPDEWGGRMIRDLPQGEDCIYYRAYLKLDDGFPSSVDAALRVIGVTGVRDGQPTYQTYGAETPRPDGAGPFWLDLWLDGTEVLTCEQAFFRSTGDVHIRSILDQARLDGHLHFKAGGQVWVDDLVVAKSYIGPMARGADPAARRVELRVNERQGVARRGEPVTFAVPLPKGDLRSTGEARLLRDGKEVPAQFRATGLWRPGESIRWLLADFQTDIEAGSQQTYTLEYGGGVSGTTKPAPAVRIEEDVDAYTVDTGAAVFRISRRVFDLFHEVRLSDGTILVARPGGAVVRGLAPMVTRPIPGAANKGHSHLIQVVCSPKAGIEDYTLRFSSNREFEVTGAKSGPVGRGVCREEFTSTDGLVSIPGEAWLNYAWPEKGDVYTFRTIPGGSSAAGESVRESIILERGPLRSVIRLKGSFGPAAFPVLEYTAWYHFYAGSGRVKLAFTLENNQHGGRTSTGNARNADIGGINCVFFDGMALRLPLSLGRASRVCIGGDARGRPFVAPLKAKAEIYQDSSGGDEWDRYRDARFHPRPASYVSFRGYRMSLGGAEAAAGLRAPGWMDVSGGAGGLTVAMSEFWQNYPKALWAEEDGTIEIGLFPGQYAADFPLRSGEHKTHEVLFFFHPAGATDDRIEAVAIGFSDPLRLEPSPGWIAGTRALADLHPLDMENYRAYEIRNLSAIGVFPEGVPQGPSLLSRREENEFYGWMDYGDVPIDFEAPSGQWGMKYDLDYRMAQQYARSLDPSWWDLFVAADKHTRDIDIHHQPHYPGLHFVKGGVWAHSTHNEPGHTNPHRNYNQFTKDLCFGARGTATLYYLTGDWKSHDSCLEIAENALAEYMSPQRDPGAPAENNRMGDRGEGGTLTRLLEGYLLSGDETYLERARWQIKSCAFDGKPPRHGPISLWASLFYMEALARYVEVFPDDKSAESYFLAHAETLRKSVGPAHGMLYTITPKPDGNVTGNGDCSHYNILAADILSLAYRLTGREDHLETARRCFAYGVKNANGEGGSPFYFQVHSANGALHGNVFMATERGSADPKARWRCFPRS